MVSVDGSETLNTLVSLLSVCTFFLGSLNHDVEHRVSRPLAQYSVYVG